MKTHTTNYYNTFIESAECCPATSGIIPSGKKTGEKSIAEIQFDILSKNPYKYTSDEVLFRTHALRKHIADSEINKSRELFFSKGQPCFRCSPLTKRYGWGIHSNEDGKIALYGKETEEYTKFAKDKNLNVVKAMGKKKAVK